MYGSETCDQEASRDYVDGPQSCCTGVILSTVGVRDESEITQRGKATVVGGSRSKRIIRLSIVSQAKSPTLVKTSFRFCPLIIYISTSAGVDSPT